MKAAEQSYRERYTGFNEAGFKGYEKGYNAGAAEKEKEMLSFLQEFIEHEYHEVRDVEFYYENWKMKKEAT